MQRAATLLVRAVSKAMDFIIIFAAAEALPKAGGLAGLGYLLVGDGLQGGRSIGKRLTGLRVANESGGVCSIRDSMIRNSTLALGLVLWELPALGWLLLAAVMAFECIMLLGSEENRRLGDELAHTSVVETTGKEEES
jgi:uncharacterized RDD family membrane protein YckC